tara:strand:- start:948 stop:1136 length:189 start_codon:yes stop_codon:yes gene_type:complete
MKKTIKRKFNRTTPKNDVGYTTKTPVLKEIGWTNSYFDNLNSAYCNDIYNLDDDREDSLGVS